MTGQYPAELLLSRLAARKDLVLVALLLLTVAMMVLPLPTMLADILIAMNIGISTVLVMVAIYVRAPAEFSTLPAIILITTAFRLSLSITTSRMVLVQADAGEVIRTFGEFVIAGNVVVGLVIYLIITIVQFVVITKGSERVAEVAARFTLDALPGRQISIDTDLKNGDIDQAEARRRRSALQRESQLYGAMDGAMKFVKGDAIASLIIIVVNLIGGIAIGCLQRGLSFDEAVHTYSLLAVGDGLIAQIPALLISLTAGIIVTRVTHEQGSNLGHDIIAQLTAEPRTIQVAAVVLGALGFIPGFPTVVFLVFGFALGVIAWLLSARNRREDDTRFAAARTATLARPVAVAVRVHLGRAFLPLQDAVADALRHAGAELSEQIGLELPPLRLGTVGKLDGCDFQIEINDVPALTLRADPARLFVEEVPEALRELHIAFTRTVGPFGPETLSILLQDAAAVATAGLLTESAAAYVGRMARDTLLSHAAELVGIQETQSWLRSAEAAWGDLVREALRVAPLPRMSDLLRRLVDEQVPVRNVRQVLEAVAEWAPREQTTAPLIEHVRSALRRQICHRWASGKTLLALPVEGSLEEALGPALVSAPQGVTLALDSQKSASLAESVRAKLRGCWSRGQVAVLITSSDLRRPLHMLLLRNGVVVPVLSFNEIAPEFHVQLVGSLSSGALLSRAGETSFQPEARAA